MVATLGNTFQVGGLELRDTSEVEIPALWAWSQRLAARSAAARETFEAIEAEVVRTHGRIALLACVLRGGVGRLPSVPPGASAAAYVPAS